MPQPYRLTIYENGLIDRMVSFFALKEDAVAFADGQRFGCHAVLSDAAGLVKMFPSDAAGGGGHGGAPSPHDAVALTGMPHTSHMQTAPHYREKAAEMLRFAAAGKPDMVAHWNRMAADWTALARRAEREDRFLAAYLPRA